MVQVEYLRGRACPVIRCDGCGSQIVDAELAGVVWGSGDWMAWGRGPDQPRFFCKDNGCLARAEGPWEELGTWLVFLAENAGLTPRRWRAAQRVASLVADLTE
jgi:hypothetical protein